MVGVYNDMIRPIIRLCTVCQNKKILRCRAALQFVTSVADSERV